MKQVLIRGIILFMLLQCFGCREKVNAQDTVEVFWYDSTGQIIKKQLAEKCWNLIHGNLIPIKLKGKIGLTDTMGRVIVDPIYDDIYFNSAEWPFVYRKGELFGYVNPVSGREITDAIYLTASSFHENRAAVSLDNKKFGFIDSTGRVVIQPQWNLVSDFYKGIAKVVLANDLSSMPFIELPHTVQIPTPGKCGLIDLDGRYIIPAEYSFVDINRDEPFLRFNNGKYHPENVEENDLRKVYSGKWGLIDMGGKVIVPDTLYDYIFPLWIDDRYFYGIQKDTSYSILNPETNELIIPWGHYSSDNDMVLKAKTLQVIH